jgi:hypothetical protein
MKNLFSIKTAGNLSVIILLCFTPILTMEPEITIQEIHEQNVQFSPLSKIGDYPFPTNPLNDRARGYLLKGKVKSAVGNFGNFIEWLNHPAGLWGNYTYLPRVAFVAGVPGQNYSYHFEWDTCGTVSTGINIWCSSEAYDDWYSENDEKYVGIVFEALDDKGIVGSYVPNIALVQSNNQWGFQGDEIFISLPVSSTLSIDPNKANVYGDPLEKKSVGLIYPWALRPKLSQRTDDFDVYDYGEDKEEWTSDDEYSYFGATVSESWVSRYSPKWNTDWQPVTFSRSATHNLDVTAGDIFGDTPFTDSNDPYPLLAHSSYSDTWPVKITEFGTEPFWPGWWAEDFVDGLPGCSGSRKDPDCWQEVPGRHISDNDVYMEFDDRWAHQGNIVDTNDEYEQTGYPMGLRVMAEAHSYGVSFAEDILFVTVKVRNESGDWCAFERHSSGGEIPVNDEDGNQLCGTAMVMPDGTVMNRGKGFDYEQVYLGFYMDADVVTLDTYGNNFHTNDDDFMEYYWERFYTHNDSMLISMAMVYDWDGNSAGATDIGIVAAQLLDTPLATEPVDLDDDGFDDIYPGEPLKMTDWHWFDWYNRPGVVTRESNTGCHAGSPGCPQAFNREEIQYKLMAGDTTNLSEKEKSWYFHTDNPDLDMDVDLNPHFDSLEGLEREDVFLQGEEGLDCVLLFSCGPFDLKVGEEVPFSFCIIFGENKLDLINNARFAQIMYNSHYQSYTPPAVPNVTAITDHQKITLTWDDGAEKTIDAVTGYADFEGYKVYKSSDGGETWGNPEDIIYDDNGIQVGWKPIAQFDLSANDDSLFCVFTPDSCSVDDNRGISISGADPLTPWFHLGSNSGLQHSFVDTVREDCPRCGVVDGIEYTYSVTSYDMGIRPPFVVEWSEGLNGGFIQDTVFSSSNPLGWSAPDGYQSIESSKGTTIHDPNFLTVTSGFPANPNYALSEIKVVPNPYFTRSYFNENEYIRRIRFTKLPAKCNVSIFTITGELITKIAHENETDSNEWWDLRTVNNQEIGPGLYLYAVETETEKHVGKFVIVR